jgi:hypothetical protein
MPMIFDSFAKSSATAALASRTKLILDLRESNQLSRAVSALYH